LQQGHNQEALTEFQAELKQAPNLYLALTGAAQAAERAGNREAALTYYRKLTEVAANGDRPEIEVARKKLQESKASGGGQ
jgi:Tfp pilus assembly protein PilF